MPSAYFSFQDIKQYHSDLSNQVLSCTNAVEHYLAQIEKYQNLNAFISVYREEAIERAAKLDKYRAEGKPLKRLHGVVIGIKDVLCYAGHEVTAASKILKGFTSIYTATAVQRLLDEDAIIIGNCNCDEFAMGSTNEHSAYGSVLNALDETRVPGGSSGGSAVAVQAGMCMVALGSDTGGSVRQPAGYCGIVGLKPGYGRVSRYGLIAYASSFDHVGILSNTTGDASLVLEVISGSDKMDSTSQLREPFQFKHLDNPEKKFKLAYFRQAFEHPSLDPEIKNSIQAVLKNMEALGHSIVSVEFDLMDQIVPAYYVITTAEASSNLSRYDGVRFGHRSTEELKGLTDLYTSSRSEGFGREVQRRIMLGTFVLSSGYYDAYYNKAQQVRRLVIDQINTLLLDFDAIILPTSPAIAPKIGAEAIDPIAGYLSDIFTVLANLAGLPALSIPLFQHQDGMPFGLQIMTSKTDEVTLLQLGGLMMDNYCSAP